MNILSICNFEGPKYFIISDHAPSLVYYSHLPLIIICVFVTLLIIIRGRDELRNRILLFILIPFGLWVFSSLITWTSNRSDVVMTFWSITLLVEPIIYIGGLYLVQFLIEEKDISFKKKLIMGLLYLPVIILLPTKFTLHSFDTIDCSAVEGIVANYYIYLIEIIYLILIIRYTLNKLTNNKEWYSRKKIILISTGIISFLLIFSLGNIVGSFTNDWKLGAFGLFGMPIFIAFLVYNIITFNIFNLKLIGRNILVITLLILIGSLTTITNPDTTKILTIITFIISLILGIILIKSTRKEVVQLEKIELLASNLNSLNSTLSDKVEEQTMEISLAYELEKKARRDLEKLNENKDQFIRIAQHNLRIPINNIKNKIDSVLTMDVDSNLKKTLSESEDSIEHLKLIADDFLNVTKLKPGDQILNPSITNIKPILESVLQELRIEIVNLEIHVTYPATSQDWVDIRIDSNKIREVLTVIIENAIRYNIKNGKIDIETRIEKDLFTISIQNTGVGITLEENINLSNRSFYRSKRVQSINPTGMGIGLSVSRSIIEAHHGTLTIESEGEGRGARVTLSLPIDFLKT